MVGKNLIVQCNGYPPDDVDEEQPSTSHKLSNTVPDEPFAAIRLQSDNLRMSPLQMPVKIRWKINLFIGCVK